MRYLLRSPVLRIFCADAAVSWKKSDTHLLSQVFNEGSQLLLYNTFSDCMHLRQIMLKIRAFYGGTCIMRNYPFRNAYIIL